jgi:hypothetical protein
MRASGGFPPPLFHRWKDPNRKGRLRGCRSTSGGDLATIVNGASASQIEPG